MTIGEKWRSGIKALLDISDAPDLDAQWLLMKALDVKTIAELIERSSADLPDQAEQAFDTLLAERLSGKPLAYILGWAEFYGRAFLVNEQVLVPRPETEELIRRTLTVIKKMSREKSRSLRVADIGTGSGCVAITLALESKNIDQIYSVDISDAALEVARTNAATLGALELITFAQGDMLTPINDVPIDLIVSNPPYVPSGELENLNTKEKSGLTFEPRIALDGGQDGLTFVAQIKASGIPAIVETVGGIITTFNL